MKIPGPDHPITITPATERVRVTFNGQVVADSKRALVLQEASYKPVFYIPREEFETWWRDLGARDVAISWHNKNSWRGRGVVN